MAHFVEIIVLSLKKICQIALTLSGRGLALSGCVLALSGRGLAMSGCALVLSGRVLAIPLNAVPQNNTKSTLLDLAGFRKVVDLDLLKTQSPTHKTSKEQAASLAR